MTIVSLRLDDWAGVTYAERVIGAPSWDQVDAAIAALDAARHTSLTLEGASGEVMMIGGGGGGYVVFYQIGEDTFWNLRSEAPADGEAILLNCGGQEGDFRPNEIVDADRARAAARTMLDVGGIDVTLGWERQD